MLFNSFSFLFLFLPICLYIFFVLGSFKAGWAVYWLFFASLVFYGAWNPIYLPLPLISIVFNYFCGQYLDKNRSKILLFFALFLNLSLLIFFKYTQFTLDNIAYLFSINVPQTNIILPLAISFFTFQQIAYLIDVYHNGLPKQTFISYLTFVIFFPHFIAGPIVHHRFLIPQLLSTAITKLNTRNLSIGLCIFLVGLFKKVILADAWYQGAAQTIFESARHGVCVSFLESWIGALAYTFQLYFDFSGYSDMAIGLAKMFNITFPINFNSPYKSKSIIDFWRSWHITLSTFLRDYLYIPLGGSKLGTFRHFFNIIVVMFLGGLWHGAAWGFVAWGLLHGIYIIVNHSFRFIKAKLGLRESSNNVLYGNISKIFTFFLVVIAWVFFRANSFESAFLILKGMFGFNSFILPEKLSFLEPLRSIVPNLAFENMAFLIKAKFWLCIHIMVGFCIVWGLPNTNECFQELLENKTSLTCPLSPILPRLIKSYLMSPVGAFFAALAFTYILLNIMELNSEFIYYQF